MALHVKAHELLFLCYGNYYDKCAWNLILNQTQSELAKRPRKKHQPYTRCIYVQNALKHGFILENLETHKIRVIKENQFVDFRSLFHFWLAQPELKSCYEIWMEKNLQSNWFSSTQFLRCLSGHDYKKTHQSVFTFLNMRISGIFINVHLSFLDLD